jgi:hypothetical protein
MAGDEGGGSAYAITTTPDMMTNRKIASLASTARTSSTAQRSGERDRDPSTVLGVRSEIELNYRRILVCIQNEHVLGKST